MASSASLICRPRSGPVGRWNRPSAGLGDFRRSSAGVASCRSTRKVLSYAAGLQQDGDWRCGRSSADKQVRRARRCDAAPMRQMGRRVDAARLSALARRRAPPSRRRTAMPRKPAVTRRRSASTRGSLPAPVTTPNGPRRCSGGNRSASPSDPGQLLPERPSAPHRRPLARRSYCRNATLLERGRRFALVSTVERSR